MARARRGRGEGAIHFKEDRQLWCAIATTGHDEHGKRKRKYLYGKTKKEVRDKLTKLQKEVATGGVFEPKDMPLGDYLLHWLEGTAKATIRETTYVSYEGVIRVHIKPRIGSISIAKLRPSMIQAFYTKMEEDGVSARGREKAHAILHRALKIAVKWGYLQSNPCEAVDRPKSTAKEFTVWSEQEVAKFLKTIRGDRLEALYIVALMTGLRQGEILGLQWQDINFDKSTLSIQRSLKEVQGRLSLSEPKTKSAKRKIVLPRIAVEALKNHRTANNV